MSKDIYDSIGSDMASHEDVTSGQMFGKPCLKVGNKAFSAFFQDQMVFKLGQEEVNILKKKYVGAENWDPSGKKRPMKDWIQIPSEYQDDWNRLANEACEYVRDQTN